MRHLVLLMLVGCGTPSPVVDAGPQCTGVPASYSALCDDLTFYRTNACELTATATLTKRVGGCDAGRVLETGSCGDGLESVRWQYGPFGDTYECVYATDGGSLTGAINFSDHGIVAAGAVGDCRPRTTACP